MNNGLVDQEKKVIFQTYKRLPIVVDRAEGCRVYDREGNSWLDFLGGIAVNALGHSHPAVVEAVVNQAKKYMHISNYFYQEPQIQLAEKLVAASGLGRVFFTNSGTEATEGAIKLVRRHGHGLGKTNMLGFSGGFHGRTYGALSLMDKPQYKENMGPYLDNMKVIKYNSPDELRANVNEQTAGIILEFVQGEGGCSTVSQEFVDTINELRSRYGFLVIADEIQAGTGRTGKFFSFEHWGFRPDIITLAKGMGGGMPLGAIVADESLANVWKQGTHGTTYGGNAVACAAGLAVVNELENGLLGRVEETGKYLRGKLEALQSKHAGKIIELRGLGLMQGVVLAFPSDTVVKAMLEHHVISNSASGTVVRIVPPLIAGEAEIDEFVAALDKCL